MTRILTAALLLALAACTAPEPAVDSDEWWQEMSQIEPGE